MRRCVVHRGVAKRISCVQILIRVLAAVALDENGRIALDRLNQNLLGMCEAHRALFILFLIQLLIAHVFLTFEFLFIQFVVVRMLAVAQIVLASLVI